MMGSSRGLGCKQESRCAAPAAAQEQELSHAGSSTRGRGQEPHLGNAAEDALLVSSLEEGSDQLDSLCPPWSPHLRAPFSKWLIFPMVLIPNRDRYSKPPARS